MSTPSEAGRARELTRFGLALAVLLFYAVTVPLAAAKVGDFYHLWLGGHLVAAGRPEALYDPAVHRALLDAVLPAGHELWAERNDLLGAFFYPPAAALLYATFCWLEAGAAIRVQAVVNIAAGCGLALVLARLSRGRLHPLAAGVLVGLLPGTFACYALGQNGLVGALVLASSGLLLARRRDLTAGLVGSLLLCKPSWLLAVGWVPLVLGRWRAVGGLVLGGAVLVAASTAVTGPGPWVEYAGLVADLARLDRLPGYPLETQSNGLAVFRVLLGSGVTADVLGWTSSALVAALTAWGLGRVRGDLERVALVLCAATWINPHVHHYEVIAPVAGVAALVAGGAERRVAWRAGAAAVGLGLYLSFAARDALDLPVPAVAVLVLWGWLLATARRTR